MKLTNKTGLPEPLVRLAEHLVNNHPKFDNNRFSVTELLKSDQQIVLSRRFDSEIEIDVQDTFALWEGTAMHKLLEDFTPEERFFTEQRGELEIAPGIFVSGAFDCLDKKSYELIDYKNPKIPSVQEALSGRDDKWKKQMYFYAILIEKLLGKRPSKARIVAMCKDHSKVKANSTPDYQKEPIAQIEFNLDDQDFNTGMISDYTAKAQRLNHVLENNLDPEPCTYGDMWCKEDYAVIKKGSSRAISGGVFDNKDSAYAKWLSLPDKDKYRIYHRVSEPTNCLLYCQCRDICPQWQRIKDLDISLTEDITDSIIPF